MGTPLADRVKSASFSAVIEYSIDLETQSACDIKLGSHRYAEDPTTRILMFAINDGLSTDVWDSTRPESAESKDALRTLEKAIRSGAPLWAFNANFESTMLRYHHRSLGLKRPPSLDQWRCSATLARAAAIPSSLGKAAEFIGCKAKESLGKPLIRIFSDLTKGVAIYGASGEALHVDAPDPVRHADYKVTVAGQKQTVADAWALFVEYCRQDVEVEVELRSRLSCFALNDTETAGFRFDMRMNERGIPVDVHALAAASILVDAQRESITTEFLGLTGLKPTQTGKLITWLRERGYPGASLAKDIVDKVAADGYPGMTPEAIEAIKLRGEITFAAVNKVDRMLHTVTSDDRLHDQFMFYGAQRTGRWSSRGVQIQNVKRPTINNLQKAYDDIRYGLGPDLIKFFHGGVNETVASCVRNFIRPPGGAAMLDVDYSNIEGRVAAWLAGQDDKLELYEQGVDLYKVLASRVFGVPVDKVTKDQRFVGKVGELGLGFGAGIKTFHRTCADWGMPIELELAAATVKTYREVNDKIVSTWRRTGEAMVVALLNPGDEVMVNNLFSFTFLCDGPFERLILRLPSGRPICYPKPEMHRVKVEYVNPLDPKDVRDWVATKVTFAGQERGHATWGRVGTSGPDAYQSAVQGTARDILLNGCLEAEARGYDIFAVIHDEALAHDGDIEGFIDALCSKPSWLPSNFPLVAEGGKCYCYSK